jgi:hypothetical protein
MYRNGRSGSFGTLQTLETNKLMILNGFREYTGSRFHV